jgi:hypothetical protein
MPLPSLYKSSGSEHPWNVARATCYGAALGALAALFKTMGPLRAGGSGTVIDHLLEIALAALGFALLCCAAAMLRNRIVRHLVAEDDR